MNVLEDFGGWRPVVLVEDPEAAAAGFASIADAQDGVIAVSEASLAADWPDYVVARARLGGAIAAVGDSASAAFMRLAEGSFLGRSAVAGLAGGALVFLILDAGAEAAQEEFRRAA